MTNKKPQYKNPQFGIRIPRELIEKIMYISNINSRTTTKEIEFIIKKYIQEYEKENGEIILNESTKQD